MKIKKLALILSCAFILGCDETEETKQNNEHQSPSETTSTDQNSVFFESPKDGETVSSPVKVKMGIKGMTVQPAGELKENTGHHHIVIDGGPVNKGQVVAKDETHLHFGKGQNETELELKPGKHTLTLQFADGAHSSYGEPLSQTITINVKDPSAASVFFESPKDGETVSSPVKVKMGVKGMTVQPAGELKENTGHHHIVIDGGPVDKGQVVPKDDTHRHFGKGQSETELELKPGKHALTLQFADGAHTSYGEALSQTINIEVKEGSQTANQNGQEWACTYKGNWFETKANDGGKLVWTVKWIQTTKGNDWDVSGDTKDQFGNSSLAGSCSGQNCLLTQTYLDGELKGRKYYFTGVYTDKTLDKGKTENNFNGTWGNKPDNRADGGTWDAVATCERTK